MSLVWEQSESTFFLCPKFYAHGKELEYNIYKQDKNIENEGYQLEIIHGDSVLELLFHKDVGKIKKFCEAYEETYNDFKTKVELYKSMVTSQR